MIETLINFYINTLESETNFKVIKAYDTEQEISLNGVLAVNCTDIQPALNGTDASLDRIYTITISGQTLFSEDATRSKIMEIADEVSRIDFTKIKDIEGVYGSVSGSMDISTDEESNTFVFNISVYTI